MQPCHFNLDWTTHAFCFRSLAIPRTGYEYPFPHFYNESDFVVRIDPLANGLYVSSDVIECIDGCDSVGSILIQSVLVNMFSVY